MKVSFLLHIINKGVLPSQSISEQKRIRNTNLLSVVASSMAFLVMIFYFFLGMYLLGSLVLLMSAYFAFNLLLSEKGLNKQGRNFSLIATNIILFFGASVMGRHSGVIFIFFPLICLSVFYFGSNEKWKTAFFMLFSFFSIQLLELTDYSLFKNIYSVPTVSESLYILHLNVGLFLTCFFVFYVFINYRESEEVLVKRKRTLETIFNNSSDAIFIVNYETLLIEDCNQKAIELFEANDRNELLKTRYTTLLKDFYKNDNFLEVFEEVKKNNSYEQEVEFITKKERIFWGSMSMKVFDLEKNHMLYFRILDVTTRKNNEERLKSTHNELEQFMYKSSHNLKGPSASILGLIEVAKKEINDPTALKYLEMIELSSQRLDSTLIDLLNITRIKQGGIVVSDVDLKKAFNEVQEDLQFYPGYSKVTIKTFIENLDIVHSDLNLIKSIIHNLLENAIKYRDSAKDSFVNVSITEIGNQIRIEITDNGIGIPLKFRDKIFNMFFRAHEISHGTGLGLYIVKNSVDKLNGKITMESIEGKGTTFIVTFPRFQNSLE